MTFPTASARRTSTRSYSQLVGRCHRMQNSIQEYTMNMRLFTGPNGLDVSYLIIGVKFLLLLLTMQLSDTDDIQLIITVFWHATDAAHDGFLKWFETDFTPGMLASPELLRARVFKLQHASVYENGQVKEQDVGEMFQYMTIWEIDGDELPWEALLYLGSSERWRYYIEGGHVVSSSGAWCMKSCLLMRSSNGSLASFWSIARTRTMRTKARQHNERPQAGRPKPNRLTCRFSCCNGSSS
jgi:hypothetical protein